MQGSSSPIAWEYGSPFKSLLMFNFADGRFPNVIGWAKIYVNPSGLVFLKLMALIQQGQK